MKQTAVIADNWEMFKRWAYERRIRRTKHQRIWIDKDKDEEYHVILLEDPIWKVMDSIAGKRFDEVEDISFFPLSIARTRHFEEVEQRVKSRVKRETYNVYEEFKKTYTEGHLKTIDDFKKEEIVTSVDIADGVSTTVVAAKKDGKIYILDCKQERVDNPVSAATLIWMATPKGTTTEEMNLLGDGEEVDRVIGLMNEEEDSGYNEGYGIMRR